jgi:hypothetical protein
MGLPPGWVTDVPGISRSAQLRALGNGVIPAQAATALTLLLADVLIDHETQSDGGAGAAGNAGCGGAA